MASSTISEKIRKQLAAVPARPGVYIMRNAKGEVIYVGKAAKLKDRVRSYFGSPHMMEPKTRALRDHIDDFEYIVVGNAGEALILEATLIKRHQPFFNIRLKDDKRYPYLKVDVQNPWPRVYITRRIEKDGARYFGPYASAGSVRATLDLTKKLFPWRSCTKEITGKDARPCLDYYIKRCIAPCTGYCTREEYDEVIEDVILFLEGKSDDVLRRLRQQMEAAAERMEYERAAQVRDQLRSIERTVERQMVSTTRKEDVDIFGMAREGDQACVQVFFVRGTQMMGRDTFVGEGVRDESDSAVLTNFILQYYEGAQYVPKLVALPAEAEDRDTIEELLSEKRGSLVEVRVPERRLLQRLERDPLRPLGVGVALVVVAARDDALGEHPLGHPEQQQRVHLHRHRHALGQRAADLDRRALRQLQVGLQPEREDAGLREDRELLGRELDRVGADRPRLEADQLRRAVVGAELLGGEDRQRAREAGIGL